LWFVWDGSRLVLATARATRTARNLQRAGWVRLALGSPNDVVIVEGTAEVIDSASLDQALADTFATRTHWEPRREPTAYVYVVVSPQRIQAWRGVKEIPDRIIMDQSHWL
jgi:general stress protein 26